MEQNENIEEDFLEEYADGSMHFLKKPVALEEFRDGTFLEFEDFHLNPEKEEYFEDQKLLNLGMAGLGVDSDDEEEDEDSYKMPFEKLAAKMTPLREDKGVLKKEIKPGYGKVVPAGSFVTIHYNAYLELSDEPFDSTRLRNRPYKTLMEHMVTGLAVAVGTMKKGETSKFLIAPEYAYGKMGCPPRIPPNSTILYEIELINFVDGSDSFQFDRLSEEEKAKASFQTILSACKADHKNGNNFFASAEYHKAVRCYQKAVNVLERTSTSSDEEEKLQQQLLLKVLLNASLCNKMLNNPEASFSLAMRVLRIDPKNVKALTRCGQAKHMLHSFEEAKKFYLQALKLEPSNSYIICELKRLDVQMMKEHEMEKAMCQRMFVSSKSGGPNLEEELSEDVKKQLLEKVKDFKNGDLGTLEFSAGFFPAQLDYLRSLASEYGLQVEDLTGDIKGIILNKK